MGWVQPVGGLARSAKDVPGTQGRLARLPAQADCRGHRYLQPRSRGLRGARCGSSGRGLDPGDRRAVVLRTGRGPRSAAFRPRARRPDRDGDRRGAAPAGRATRGGSPHPGGGPVFDRHQPAGHRNCLCGRGRAAGGRAPPSAASGRKSGRVHPRHLRRGSQNRLFSNQRPRRP